MRFWRDVGEAITVALRDQRSADDQRWFWQRMRIQTSVLSRRMGEVRERREALGNPRLLP